MHGVSNHQPYDCLLNCLFERRSKKTSRLRVTGLCEGNSPVTVEFSAQMASNAEKASIQWPYHVTPMNRVTMMPFRHLRIPYLTCWWFRDSSNKLPTLLYHKLQNAITKSNRGLRLASVCLLPHLLAIVPYTSRIMFLQKTCQFYRRRSIKSCMYDLKYLLYFYYCLKQTLRS